MRSFEFISHTAEAGLRLEADSMEELFRAGLEGMAAWLRPDLHREVEGEWRLSVESATPDTLLVDFLADTLTRSQIHRIVFFDAVFDVLEPPRLEATLRGRAVDCFDDDIKAITYHGAGIRRTDSGAYESEVIFDI